MNGFLCLLVFIIRTRNFYADANISASKHKQDVQSADGRSYQSYKRLNDIFQKLYQQRVQVGQEHNDFMSTAEERKILDTFIVWRNNQKDPDTHESVKVFCTNNKLINGCSWKEANLLLSKDAEIYKFQKKLNKLNFQTQWIDPTEQLMKSFPSKTQTQCKRINKFPSPEDFFQAYVSKGIPVIISSGLKQLNWKALEKWNIDYLSKFISKDSHPIHVSLNEHIEQIMKFQDWKDIFNETLSRSLPGNHQLQHVDNFFNGEIEHVDDPNELIQVKSATFIATFEDFIHLSHTTTTATSTSNNTTAPPHKLTYSIHDHDLRKWNDNNTYDALFQDMSPSIFDEYHNINNPTNNNNTANNNKTNTESNSTESEINLKPAAVKHSFGLVYFLALENHYLDIATSTTKHPLRYDENENIYAVIKGNKTFEIFHPSQHMELYETHSSYRSGHMLYEYNKKLNTSYIFRLPVSSTQKAYQPFSPVNITHPDFKKHPLYKNARKLTCELQEGDILHLPSYWYHETVSHINTKDKMSASIKTSFKPWWLKHSNNIQFTLNPFYAHLHHNYNVTLLNSKTHVQQSLDINYWRTKTNHNISNHANIYNNNNNNNSSNVSANNSNYNSIMSNNDDTTNVNINNNINANNHNNQGGMKILIFLTGYRQLKEYHYFNIFLKQLSLYKLCDLYIYCNNPNVSSNIMKYYKKFQIQNKTLYISPLNSGIRIGGVEAISQAFDMGIFKNYDYIIHMHPDVFITDDTYLLHVLESNRDNDIAFFVTRNFPQNVDPIFYVFDFFIFKPKLIKKNIFQKELYTFQEIPEYYLCRMLYEYKIKHVFVPRYDNESWVPRRIDDHLKLYHEHDLNKVKVILQQRNLI